MSFAKNPKLQYLKRRPPSRPDGSWYLNVPIPKDLQAAYPTKGGKPQTHKVKALGTKDPEEAYQRKVVLMPSILAEFRQKARELRGATPADLLEAQSFRARLQEASNADDYDLASTMSDVVTSTAERIHAQGGNSPDSLRKAQTFVRIAEGAETLHEAFNDWVARSNLPARTQAKYRTALDEFCAFLGGHPLVPDMSRENAIRYVDWLNREGRSQRTGKLVPLSFNSKRDRVMALSAFWNKWIFARSKTTVQSNPWSRLEVTERPTPSDIKWHSLVNTGRPKRRPYFDDADLIALLDAAGPKERAGTRYPKRTLMEVLCLGLLTGARPDELCSLTLGDLRAADGGYTLNIGDAKNAESDRRIPVVHPLAVAVLKRRIGDRTDPAGQLFAEFRPKEGNSNLAELVLRALGRHLERATGITADAVPYCTRHTFTTVMGNRGDVSDAVLKRYVGHKPAGITDAHYRSITPASLLDLATKVQYPESIEKRMGLELGFGPQAGE